MPKNVQTTVQLHSFHMLARWCSKSFKLASAIREPRTSRYTSWIYKLDFEQAEEPEIKLPRFIGLWRKKGNLRRTSTSASLTAKAFDCVDYNKLWKILKEMGIPDHLTCLLRNLYVDKEATDIEQSTGSKLGKEYDKAVYCHSAYVTSTQSLSWEMPGRMNQKWESRLLEEILIISDMQMIPLNSLLMRAKKERWKRWHETKH